MPLFQSPIYNAAAHLLADHGRYQGSESMIPKDLTCPGVHLDMRAQEAFPGGIGLRSAASHGGFGAGLRDEPWHILEGAEGQKSVSVLKHRGACYTDAQMLYNLPAQTHDGACYRSVRARAY